MKANSAPFTKDVGKAKDSAKDLKKEVELSGSSLTKFGEKMAGFGSIVAGVGAAIGVAAIAKGLFDLTSQSMQTVAATGKLSDQLGISTEDLIGLQHAAKMTMGADQVDTFNDALKEMQKKIGEVSFEGAGQKEVFERLGLDDRSAQGAISSIDQVADAVGDIGNKSTKFDFNIDSKSLLGDFDHVISSINSRLPGLNLGLDTKSLITQADEAIKSIESKSPKLSLGFDARTMIDEATQGLNQVGAAVDGVQSKVTKLNSVGLDLKKMAGQGAVENFGMIADAIKKVESRAEKLDIVDKIFGGAGAQLLPLLEQGSGAINEFTAEAEKLGLMFSNVDAEKVNQANMAMTKLSEIVTGVGQQLAISLAPYITAAAESFVGLGVQGVDVSGYISSGMRLVGQSVGVVADIVNTLKIGWKFLQTGATSAIGLILESVATLGEGLEYLLNLIPGVSVEFGTMARDMADDVNKLANDQFKEAMSALAAPPPSEGINQFFDNIESNAKRIAEEITNAKKPVDSLGESFANVTKKVGDLEKKLREQIATFGLSSEQVEIYKLKQEGANESQIASVKGLAAELAKLEEKKKVEDDLKSKAKGLMESTKTPLEKYQTEIKELRQMLDGGLIDKKTFDRASQKANGDLVGEKKFGGSALKVGSDEGRNAILKFKGLDRKDPNIGVEKNTTVLVTEAKKQTALFEKVLKSLDTDNSYSFN